jgi:hypothetical protein
MKSTNTLFNHRGDSKDDNESQGGRLYVMPSNPLCPVKSFVKYLSVLHPDCDYFWQRPKPINFNRGFVDTATGLLPFLFKLH